MADESLTLQLIKKCVEALDLDGIQAAVTAAPGPHTQADRNHLVNALVALRCIRKVLDGHEALESDRETRTCPECGQEVSGKRGTMGTNFFCSYCRREL